MRSFWYRHSLILLLALTLSVKGQVTTDSISSGVIPSRLRTVVITESVMYGGSMIALSNLWYKGHDQSAFHFFNDNDEWLQIDKAGHALTAYHIGLLGMDALRWSGVEDRKAIWYGGSLGFVFLTSVEVFDGFSASWGASTGDVISNAVGASILIGQELLFEEQVVSLKYSYSSTKFPDYRPELLGSAWYEQMLKDYNGQTYWASVNLHALRPSAKFPKWLNVAFGYGANGMVGGSANPAIDDEGHAIPEFQRYRQYYLSLDVDLTRIPAKSKCLRTILKAISFVKVPFPALELNRPEGLKFHPLLF